MAQVAGHRLRDVDGEIADALEVGVDLDGGDDGAKIDRHRLIEGQQCEAAAVDLDMELVDRRVAGEHVLHDRGVARDQPLDGGPHAVLGEAAHFQQPPFEMLEFLLKMRYHAVCH